MIEFMQQTLLFLYGVLFLVAGFYTLNEVDPVVYSKKENVRFTLIAMAFFAFASVNFYAVLK